MSFSFLVKETVFIYSLLLFSWDKVSLNSQFWPVTLCRLGCAWTQRYSFFCLLSTEIKGCSTTSSLIYSLFKSSLYTSEFFFFSSLMVKLSLQWRQEDYQEVRSVTAPFDEGPTSFNICFCFLRWDKWGVHSWPQKSTELNSILSIYSINYNPFKIGLWYGIQFTSCAKWNHFSSQKLCIAIVQ